MAAQSKIFLQEVSKGLSGELRGDLCLLLRPDLEVDRGDEDSCATKVFGLVRLGRGIG